MLVCVEVVGFVVWSVGRAVVLWFSTLHFFFITKLTSPHDSERSPALAKGETTRWGKCGQVCAGELQWTGAGSAAQCGLNVSRRHLSSPRPPAPRPTCSAFPEVCYVVFFVSGIVWRRGAAFGSVGFDFVCSLTPHAPRAPCPPPSPRRATSHQPTTRALRTHDEERVWAAFLWGIWTCLFLPSSSIFSMSVCGVGRGERSGEESGSEVLCVLMGMQ